MPNELHAVLTGDIVASRSTEPARVDRAIAALSEAARELDGAWATDTRFTRYRGDGWQVLVNRPRLAVQAMIFLHARLRAADLGVATRIAAGIGPITTPGTGDLSDATGPAFFASGKTLDNTGKRRFGIAGQGIGIWQKTALALVEQIVTGWTQGQAEAAAIAILTSDSQDLIARQLGLTRQAVQSRLAGAGIAPVTDALSAFAEHDFAREPAQ